MMEFGFEIKEEEGRKGVEYACYRNGKQCTTGLGKPVVFKSRKAAQSWISKQVAIYQADALISDEDRASMRAESERKEIAAQAEKNAAINERLQREREDKDARENRARLNNTLRAKGYKWVNVGFKSEEDADAFDLNLPVGDDWQLVSPEWNVVSLSAAKTAIGWQVEMEPKRKMGRPSQGKGWKSFSLDQEILEYLDSLPDGERSRFVNTILAKGIAELKGNQKK